jgi:N-acetylglucosamine-6-phosphate deacetylase
MGIDNVVGTLEKGKYATLVLLKGDIAAREIWATGYWL